MDRFFTFNSRGYSRPDQLEFQWHGRQSPNKLRNSRQSSAGNVKETVRKLTCQTTPTLGRKGWQNALSCRSCEDAPLSRMYQHTLLKTSDVWTCRRNPDAEFRRRARC